MPFYKNIMPDMVSVALFVTLLWAKAGLYCTYVFETMFKLVLKVPDRLLYGPASLCGAVTTTQKKAIRIISANTRDNDVTNKFKLFLRYYWTHGGGAGAFNTNGFSINKLCELLQCSLLYCTYMLSDSKKETRWIMLDCDENSQTSNKNIEPISILMGHVTLDNEPPYEEKINNELFNELFN